MKKLNEAINICLQVLGEQTLESDISIEDIYEAEQADIVIENVKSEILAEGWSFNSEESWPLLPDTDGYIAIPETALALDPTSTSSNYIYKDGKLYDKENKTYKFDTAVEFDVVWELDFDDLPLVAQQYITLKAARVLYQRIVGDVNMFPPLMEDEREALLRLRNYEDDINDYNIFDNQEVSRILTRTSNPTGIIG